MMIGRIHIIDRDVRRRANVAHDLSRVGEQVEIYEDVREFFAAAPTDGLILAGEDSSDSGAPIEDLRSNAIVLPIIAYAEDPKIERVVHVMLGGAAGYLSLPFNNNDLVSTLDRMLETHGARRQGENAMAKARRQIEELTGRERQVLTALVAGMSNKVIARALRISPRTVEIHRSKMMARLGASSVAEAVKIGLYAGLDNVSLHEDKAA